MQEVFQDRLWVGNARDARDFRLLFASGIAAVVDVAYEEPPAQLPRELIYCRFPITDSGDNLPEILKLAVQTVLNLVTARVPVLVACSAGMSRDPTIAAFALAAYLNMMPDQIIQRIGETRGLEINPILWEDVRRIVESID